MTSAHMAALSLTLSIYAILAVSYFGWGTAATYLLGLKGQENSSATASIWLGWAFTLLIFQLIHLVSPVIALVVIPVFIIGFAIAIPQLVTSYRHHAKQLSVRKPWISSGIMALVLTVSGWTASRSMLPPTHYDSGVYHLSAIRWTNSFPIVPGLGNLDGRLAFNQSFFTYVAALNFYPFFGHGRCIANSFLFLLTLATFVGFLHPLFKEPSLLTKLHPFQYAPSLFTLPVLAYLALSSDGLASPSPDLASILLQLVMFVILAYGVGAWIRGQRKQPFAALFLVVLAATAVTIKLTNLAFSAVMMGFVLAYTWQTTNACIRGGARILLPAIILIVVWCLRGFVLSGAPLYPSTIGYIPVDWAVPREQVVKIANWVYSWARKPGAHWRDVLGSWDWFEPWIFRISKNFTVVVWPLVLSVVLGCVVAGMSRFRKKARLQSIEWAILLPSLMGLIYWFFTAPSLRFAQALFFLLPISVILLFFSSMHGLVRGRAWVSLVCVVFVVGNFNLLEYATYHIRSVRAVSTSGWHAVWEVPLVNRVTGSGLVVYIPKLGNQCWDAPVPCTPKFNNALRLRVPGDMASGFSVKAP